MKQNLATSQSNNSPAQINYQQANNVRNKFIALLYQALLYQLKPRVAKADHNQIVSELELELGVNLSEFRISGPELLSADILTSESSEREMKDGAYILELIGAFEKKHSGWQKQKQAVFYTPIEIASQMVDRCFRALDANLLPLTLDPACGGGIFLIALIRQMRRVLSDQELLDWCTQKLCAIDRDASAVQAATAIVKLELLRLLNLPDKLERTKALKLQFHCANTLLADLQPSLFSDREQFCFSKLFSDVFKQDGFDLIVGNPPYGQSRSGLIEQQENEQLKRIYTTARAGKVNKYLLFMSRSYDLLKASGVLSFIVPNAWLGIDAGRPVRRRLLEDGALLSITRFKNRIFKGVEVENVIFLAKKMARAKQVQVLEQESLNAPASEQLRLQSAELLISKSAQIPLERDQESEKIFAHIRNTAFLLGDPHSPFASMIALQAYALGKGTPAQNAETVKQHLFHTQSKLSEFHIPYLNGKDIDRYRVTWSGSFLHWGAWLAEPQKLHRFSGPRVVIREILAPKPYCLRASVLEEPFLYNKSVLHIICRKVETDPDLVWALCAILNSKLISNWICAYGKKVQRSMFPKLLNSDLRELPLPHSLLTNYAELARLARLRASTGQDSLDEELDLLVAQAYGLG